MSVNILEDTILLPSAYQQVEYIESTGTQWIDTGIKLENNSYCNIDFKYSELQYQLMGGNSETTQRYFIGIKSTLDLFYFGTGDTNNYYYTADTNRHSFIIDMPNSKIAIDDNYNDVSFTFTNNNSSHNFYLFARINSAGEIVNNCSGRLYRALFKHNNEVIREFIPCYRKSDNEIGLYDLVNDVFYINSGSGTFLKGNDVIPKVAKKTSVYIYASNSRLPSDYQEVEYLQSSGTQYIDTGIYVKSTDVVKCKFEVLSSTSSMADAIYGCYTSSTGNFFVLLMRSPTQARVGTSSNQVNSTNYELNKVYDTSLTAGTYIENGTTYTFTAPAEFTQPVTFWVINRNQNNGGVPISAKLYSFEIVNKFNGIPCYRKSDGVAGLYDTVSNTFFTNAGTGTFTVGNNVYSDGYHLQKVRVNILSPTNNLLKIWRKEWSTDTKNPTDAVTFDYNKLYYMASSGYLRQNPGNLAETITRDYVTYTQTSSSWWGIGFPMEVKPNTKYTISATRNDGNKTKINYTLYNADGTFGSYEQLTTNTSLLDVSRTITTGANSKTLIVLVCGITSGDTVYAKNIQVEESQTKTTYKPYYREIIKI